MERKMKKFPYNLICSSLILFIFLINPVISEGKGKKAQYLIKIVKSGGLCPYGVCHMEIILDTDGKYTWTEGQGKSQKMRGAGSIKLDKLLKIKHAIENTSFDKIKSKKFKGLCPTAVDGFENHFYFYIDNKIEVISSCKYEIDTKLTIFTQLLEFEKSLYKK
jgi:hypothetical protein